MSTPARVWYLVRDFERGRDFFKRHLGFEETFVDWDDKWARLSRGKTLVAVAEGEPNPDGGVAMVDVEDVKAEADRLRGEDVQVGVVVELVGEMWLVDVYDPDGNRVQLGQSLQ